MEGLNNQKSFEDFKSRITEIFKAEGYSENLKSEIDRWHARNQEETDRPGDTIDKRIVFQIELAEIYIAIERNDLAKETLDDAWVQAKQAGLSDLIRRIEEM